MKPSAAVRIIGSSILISLGGLCAVLAFAGSQPGSLSLEERIAYQRRLEEVYWRHRAAAQIGGQVRPFTKVMPDVAIREKVEDTLRKSAALERYWHRPVTAAQLQAEMSRIAADTRQPAMLREIWQALNNDPSLIAECLARPLLVERELSSWYARDERFHGELKSRIEKELLANNGRGFDSLSGELWERQVVRTGNSGTSKSPVATDKSDEHARRLGEPQWQQMIDHLAAAFAESKSKGATTAENLPVSRTSSLQESDSEFYVLTLRERSEDRLTIATKSWPKQSVDLWWQSVRNQLPLTLEGEGDGGQSYKLPKIAQSAADDTWLPTAAPLSPRESHSAVWTGSEMIVWGGFYNPSNFTDYFVTVGGRYTPATDSWHLTRVANAPTWRERHTAVWSGTEMIVWGGYGGETGTVNTGARYNPATDAWTPTSMTNAPGKRSRHIAVWTGSRMLVWGGRSGDFDSSTINTGGSYDPVSNSWTTITTTNAPAAREYFTGVWSGTELIVWGGYNGQSGTTVNTGGRYNPQTDTWQATATGPLAKRYAQNAVWTGTRMLVWGGASDFFAIQRYNDGALYDPVSNTWTSISTTGAPSPRDAAAAVWTGTEMLIWGGEDDANRLRTGGRYNVAANTWQSLSTVAAPQSSVLMSAVWTGTEMIIWGGQEPTLAADINTGGRYNPQTDSWVSVTNPQNGGPRNEHPAVWTGNEMIVWGSYGPLTSPTNTGARYFPATDSWLATSLVNVPSRRYAPQGVWSGAEMVVWGGCSDGFCGTPRLNTGGRYNPATNSWRPTSTTNVAEARYWFSAVWSGTEMIVWGGCDAQTCGPGGNSDRFGLNNGGRYNPVTDTWTLTSLTGVPSSRWLPNAVWTGSEMIVWGGLNGFGPFNTGGRYNPVTDSWQPTSTVNAPTARDLASASWTGNRMMIFGGYNSLLDEDFNTGGLYDPVLDTWTATSLTGAPSGRTAPTAVWTGSEVIIWGGAAGPNHLIDADTGGRFDPVANTWRPTSTIEAPSARDLHTAVWTGSEMIVFGGESCARCEPVLDTGGRYAIASAPVATVAVSRKIHGSAGAFDLVMPLTGTPGIEMRTGGATNDHELIVTFNSDVSVTGNPQAAVTSGVGTVGSNGVSNGGIVTVSGNQVTIPLTNVANAQTIDVTLFGVDNGSGNSDVTLSASYLLADTVPDGVVNQSDNRETRNHLGQTTDATNFQFDVSLNGSVDNRDLQTVRRNRGSTLPP